MMIRNFRFNLIQYLLFTDDNIRHQPFDQLVHHEIQDRNLVETDRCFIKKIKEYTLSRFLHQDCLYVGIPIPAQGLDRCMTIFTRSFHVYGSHCPPKNNS